MKVVLEDGAFMPVRAHEDDAGLDFMSPADITIEARGYVRVPIGVHCSVPKGYYGKLESRSGMMARGITTMGGVIDSNYTGEISVVLENHNDYEVTIRRGDRITQMVVVPMLSVFPEPSIHLEETDRGANGFGSTGA